jgi:acyl carrier protein phosphodiesterase
MNILSHHEVARRLDTKRRMAYRFGAMVPDFIGMFDVKRTYELIDDPDLLAGIKLHQVTDVTFDNLPEMKELRRDMSRAFRDIMPKWTAAQCAGVGKDILFDSLIIGDNGASAAYNLTMHQAALDSIDISKVAKPPHTWMANIIAFEQRGLPNYADVETVANILQRRLKNTRSSFDASLVPELADKLPLFQERVQDIGSLVMTKLMDSLMQTT